MINDLEEALQNMKLRESELLREKSEWMAAQQQINQYIEGLHMDKDEVIRVHTLETAELRKKNNILKETVEKLERQVKSSAASNLSTDFSDFESLTMDNSWEDFTMTNGLPLDPESAPASSMQSSAMVLPTNDRAAEKNAATADYPFSWNAFYMCLLVGAFIASNNSALSARNQDAVQN